MQAWTKHTWLFFVCFLTIGLSILFNSSNHIFVILLFIYFFSQTDEVFLEAQIQNITTSPMFMEKVSLEPSIMYNVAELNTVDSAGERYVETKETFCYDFMSCKHYHHWVTCNCRSALICIIKKPNSYYVFSYKSC